MFTIDLTNLDGASGFSIEGLNAVNVNGDGVENLIVGAYGADNASALRGESYVIFGKAGSFGPFFNVSNLDGTNGCRIDGITERLCHFSP